MKLPIVKLPIVIIALGVFVMGIVIGMTIVAPRWGLGSCRAENPGYDCILGWVRGDAFK